MTITIPYGKKYLTTRLPGQHVLGILRNKIPAKKNAAAVVSSALDRPLGGVRLESAAGRAKKILVVVPDATRGAHLKEILPVLLRRIDDGRRAIDIIVATGLHKEHDRDRLRSLLGGALVRRYNVISHSQDGRSIARLGTTKRGVGITLNRLVAAYDMRISIGIIEPHLYAGYSGGAKTVAIGLAGKTTIDATHGTKFLDDPSVAIGSVEGNAFQETLWEIAAKAPTGYAVNIVNDAGGRALKAFAGRTKAVFAAGVRFAKTVFEVTSHRQADIVICGVGYPKDANLYQASRAINYIINVDRPVLRKGGVLIVAAELGEGIGASAAEKLFYDRLKAMRSPREFIGQIRRGGCVAGEHRAYMVAKPLVDHTVMFVSSGKKPFLKGLPFDSFPTLELALSRAYGIVGPTAKIYVVPQALSTIARLLLS